MSVNSTELYGRVISLALLVSFEDGFLELSPQVVKARAGIYILTYAYSHGVTIPISIVRM